MTALSVEVLSDRLAMVREAVTAASAGREVRIVCVTKRFDASVVELVGQVGLKDCGENYLDELEEKDRALVDLGVERPRWHFLGAIQRNKIARITAFASEIHAVSRFVEIEALARQGYRGLIYLQVEPPGAPPGRNGAPPGQIPALVDHARALGCRVAGLMGMALPLGEEATGAYFASVRALVDRLELQECSMGMSGDYRIAVAEGATVIRLGTVLLGERAE
ncbi:MAG: alanine racemase [Ferrimicrobium sp.]